MQNLASTTSARQSTVQKYISTSRIIQYNAGNESWEAVASCTLAANLCQTITTGPTLVDPATCSALPAPSSGNSYTSSTCSTTTTGPVAVASCAPSAATNVNGWTQTTCPAPVTTTNVAVASCTNGSSGSPNYITTTCSTANVTNNVIQSSACTPGTTSSGAPNHIKTTCKTANVTTNVIQSSACTPGTTSSGSPNYISTTCADNASVATPVASCTVGTTSSGAPNYIFTTCTNNPTGPTAVASCTNGSSGSPNYITTTCSTANVTNNVIQSSACTPGTTSSGAPNHIKTTCKTANVTTNVIQSSACTPGTTSSGSPNYISTTCADNASVATPVASCTVGTTSSGAPNYIFTTCTNNPTGPTAVASCTNGSSGSPNYITTTCSTANVTNNVIQSSACTPGTTSSGAPNHIKTTCKTANVTTNVPVASCTPGTTSSGSPNYIFTTCAMTNPTIGVASCTNVPATAPNWIAITCGTNNNPNVPVASCTASLPTAINNYTTTTCPAPITTPATVQSTACTPGTTTSGSPNYIQTTCSTANVTTNVPQAAVCTTGTTSSGSPNYIFTTCSIVNSGPTPVATCSNGSSGSPNHIVTSCSTNNNPNTPIPSACASSLPTSLNSYVTTTCPAAVVVGPDPVSTCSNGTTGAPTHIITTCATNTLTPATAQSATCTPGTTTGAGPAFIRTTCVKNTTGPTAVSSCTPGTTSSGSPNYISTTCATNPTGPTAVASCANGSSGSPSYITTTCSTNTTPATAAASCTNGSSGSPNYIITSCSDSNTGPVEVANCTTAVATSPDWITASCAYLPGHKLQRRLQTSVSSIVLSGGVLGYEMSRSTTTSSTAFADVDGICHPDASGIGGAPLGTPPMDARSTVAEAAPPSGCSDWPCTVDSAVTGGSSNSLADVAQYYYTGGTRPGDPKDLRLDLDNDVRVKGNGVEDDRAKHQHMTTFALALGVSGSLEYSKTYKTDLVGDFARIRCNPLNGGCNNTCPTTDASYPNCTPKSWPVWPDPAVALDGNGNYQDTTLYNSARSIDDIWHAAVNGRGQYFSASDPNSVVNGLQTALAGIQARAGSSSAAATSTMEPVAGDNFAYRSSYTTKEWTGDLAAYTIDPATGVFSASSTWNAQSLLDTKVGTGCDNRSIYLFRAGATNNLVNFSWNTKACDGAGVPTGTADTGLNSTEKAYFDGSRVAQLSQYSAMSDGTSATVNQRTAAEGENLVNFIRGHHNLEGPALFKTNDLTTLYRSRNHALGDLVNSQPAFVKGPFASYTDSRGTGGYAAFKAANAARTSMVYVGGNDGMLHAFNASTGVEAWAVVPQLVLPDLFKLADNNYADHHRFLVDGSPIVGDIYDSANSTWKTILVGGLNKGGKGYYAMDVTDPANPKGLWEFGWSNTCWDGVVSAGADCHLGYTFGRPIITKLDDGTGEGPWVIVVTSGTNNVNSPAKTGDGEGYLYVLNAATGKLISKTSNGAGSAATPSNLNQIANFVDNAVVNNTTLHVYGGDMDGNIWRFNGAGLTDVNLLGVAKDSSGNRQPITTRPELAEISGKPWVYVATGRLLGEDDLLPANSTTQSTYGIKDTLAGSPVYADLRSSLNSLTMTQVGSGITAYRTIACSVSCSSGDGWVVDLPDSGERVNIDPKLQLGTLTFASNVPSNSICDIGGYSWLNFMDYKTGLAVSTALDHAAARRLSNSLAAGVNFLRLSDGRVVVNVISTDNQPPQTFPLPVETPPPAGKRVSWREVLE